MRTEETSGTVLHRLIQEQLRYGNPTDARTLLAIQQQALRRGSSGGGAGGAGSSQSSSESLSQDEPQSPKLSARQEPQGQEHQADYQHSESYQLYSHHHEQLPTYEQAKVQSQYLASQWFHNAQPCKDYAFETSVQPYNEDDRWDAKRGHARSLSERLMQLSLQRKAAEAASTSISSSSSYPQIAGYHANQAPKDNHGPWLEYPLPMQSQATTTYHPQEYKQFYTSPPPPFHAQHNNRFVPPMLSPEARHVFSSAPPAGREVYTPGCNQMELLMKENERLKQELEDHVEKASRIQKLEQEIQRISEAYETLMQGCVKRETLEQTLRNKLMAEVKRLQELNSELRDSLENTSAQAAKDVEAADHNQHVVSKLIMQMEEQKLQAVRLEREVEAQRRRVEALEVELSSARRHSRQLQAELQRKSAYVERVERLQGALAQLQATCEKREGLELRLRTRLEQELRTLRNQQRQTQACQSSGPASAESSASVAALLERLREREERILALEADMTRWEQKYLEESTMREFAMDAAATAAAQRDTTIINHSPCHSTKSSFSEDSPNAEFRNQEVENRIRSLYGQILEKDAVISVLQQRFQQEQEKTEASDTSPAQNTGNDGVSGQTAASVPRLCRVAAAVCKARIQAEPATPTSTTTSTTTEQSSNTEPSHESTQLQLSPQPADPFRGLDSVEAEAVEIFI
ncbi:angiomotin-like 2a [Astyanax mexicanus]|uniref:Angiomotin-like 2a n=2 Tax=Astyanax mexicanus TaxID=7994 RepID=A0A8T2KYM9_ASTMX|nr:angiomotin-like 2a [Astyanax mexicanus]